MESPRPDQGATSPSPRSGMTRAETLAFFERRAAAYARFDPAALAADYTDTATIESPIAGTHVGPAQAERALRVVFEAFRNREMTFEPPLIDGDRIAQVVTIQGRSMGDFMGLPPTDRPFHLVIVYVYELADRHIVRERRIYDFSGLLIQIGTLRVKPT